MIIELFVRPARKLGGSAVWQQTFHNFHISIRAPHARSDTEREARHTLGTFTMGGGNTVVFVRNLPYSTTDASLT